MILSLSLQISQGVAMGWHSFIKAETNSQVCSEAESNTCCSKSDKSESSENKCCKDNSCDCSCCHHLVLSYFFTEYSFLEPSFIESDFRFTSDVFTTINASIWNPPKNIFHI
jgi:hypothetical protein